MQDEVLAQPAQAGGKDQKDCQRYAGNDQRAARLVHDDLVDDDLGKQRCRQCDELNSERRQKNVTPDAAVLEQFRNEPAETEVLRWPLACVRSWRRGLLGELQNKHNFSGE